MNTFQKISNNAPCRIVTITILLAVSAATGCVARREALNVNTSLIASSEQAKVVVDKLKDASKAEVAAHLQTREAYRKLWDNYRQARNTQARQEMETAHLKTTEDVSDGLVERLLDLQVKRAEAHQQLDEKLKVAFQPLSEKILSYKNAAEVAVDREKQFPNDVDRHNARVKADTAYSI